MYFCIELGRLSASASALVGCHLPIGSEKNVMHLSLFPCYDGYIFCQIIIDESNRDVLNTFQVFWNIVRLAGVSTRNPKVLYHERDINGSSATGPEIKSSAFSTTPIHSKVGETSSHASQTDHCDHR